MKTSHHEGRMDQDIDRRTDADVARNGEVEHALTADTAEQQPADGDKKRDIRLTRRVHVVLGLVIAVLGAWLLLRSRTELAFRGPNGEPGPGYLPVLLTLCLIGLGLALSAVWLWGPKARTGEVPTLSLSPRHMARAVLVWLALVVCALLIGLRARLREDHDRPARAAHGAGGKVQHLPRARGRPRRRRGIP
jgi:hypothetical protein